jgi:bacillithiol biosynthesis deacetylase BshB1
MKLDILAVAAHPDDVELCAAGTLIAEIAKGAKVGILDITRGELGTRGSAEIRMDESAAAAEIMGLHVRENAGLHDGFFRNEEESIRTLIPFIRRFQPDIVITNVPDDRHPDHGRASKLVSDSCYYSGLIKIKTFDDMGNVQERWRPKAIYRFIQDHYHRPDFVVDITDTFEAKMESIKAYRSQFYDPDSDELDSPISGEDFFHFLESRSREMGRWIGVEFGEGFLKERPLGVDSIRNLY